MKLNALALAISLATSISLVGCGGDKNHSKQEDKVAAQTDKAAKNTAAAADTAAAQTSTTADNTVVTADTAVQETAVEETDAEENEAVETTALSVNINGATITGLTNDIVTYDTNGRITITVSGAEADVLRDPNNRLADAFHVYVRTSAEAVFTTDTQLDAPRIATKADLTARIVRPDDSNEAQIQLTIHNAQVKQINLVRAAESLLYIAAESEQVRFNIAPENGATVATALAGIVAANGTINAPLNRVFNNDNAAQLDNNGKIRLFAAITENNSINLTQLLGAFGGMSLNALNAAGIRVDAIFLTTGRAAIRRELTATDTNPTPTIRQLIEATPGSNNLTPDLHALVFSSDSGLNERGETLVALVRNGAINVTAADTAADDEDRGNDNEATNTYAVDFLINREIYDRNLDTLQDNGGNPNRIDVLEVGRNLAQGTTPQ